ncbi:IS1182 family transposase [Pelobacter propionicus]|uniref:Transposase, IS4 family n=1 Tax=Pelobacter propionicus (strain DSM 2379 / NBRC 103807 / OttBd1) TaxID=338966 RepID=A1AJZ0_PELPD|nr:IS1182 family transposase [Pelobacter propionicus]ABK97660.1 transposase, IS4 family [Pelobacter propionicus DSM 2379]ABK98157.1 transposase, IS4 family [Pelobacter propionicus DSM 2379]ABK98490.1 transposase, IS4 family [Pelobacter propionicus DSM 2379]ABK98503.1 transposase, IS4 family [Pelobacter propionicus DSM 2379]ABK98525.1 transposase, IS4 family [Pelobacter propionicus DSM 2379]
MKSKFIEVDRETPYLLPPSLQDWLPEKHLARFVVEIVEQLDLRSLKATYAGRGSQPYNPEMLVALLFYGYATGVFSSRKLERSTYDSVAFRFIAANSHPDHDTIATFRRRFLPQLNKLFAQILLIAHQMEVLKLGNVSLDGSKIKANASKHKALSYEHACKLEEQIKAEVGELLKKAEAADRADIPDGMNIPEELERREKRLSAIAAAKVEIEKRAAERHAREQAAYEKKVAERAKKEQATGKKAKGKEPKPPKSGPTAKDQVNLTDEESRIMPTSGGGFEQTYNAQAGVDTASKLIVSAHVTQNPNDKQELTPTLENLAALPEKLGKATDLVADSGYFSETNVTACEENGITPYIAVDRQSHNVPLMERFAEPPPLPEDADSVARMKHRLKTPSGKAIYAQRKVTSEPVFGIIKAVMGFRSFLLRGFEAVKGEWNLVCMAYNIKRLHVLAG